MDTRPFSPILKGPGYEAMSYVDHMNDDTAEVNSFSHQGLPNCVLCYFTYFNVEISAVQISIAIDLIHTII